MKFRPIYMDISIVTVANITRDFCNPLYLFKHNVIKNDDIESINDKDICISQDVVSFKTRNFDLYCNSVRMQVRSENVSLSSILSDITLNIIRLSQSAPKAVGINATFRFATDEPSFRKFCHRCLPNDAFGPMADNALMLDLSFLDRNHALGNGEPDVVYNIKRLPDISKEEKAVQISVNNHCPINNGIEEVAKCLMESAKMHEIFFKKCQEFIKSIQ